MVFDRNGSNLLFFAVCVIRHLVCRRGIGREIHKNGSKVLLCLRQ